MSLVLTVMIGAMGAYLVFSLLQYWTRSSGIKNWIYRSKQKLKDNQVEEEVTTLSLFSPRTIQKEFKKYKPNYSKQSYIKTLSKGVLVGLILMYFLYRSLPISILMAGFMGLLYPYLDLAKERIKYEYKMKEEIGYYFKMFSSYMRSNGYNLTKSLERCVERIEEPLLKQDLEKVLFDLKQGVAPDQAFSTFNKRYPFQGVQLFHRSAELIASQGHDEYETLKTISNRFSRKKFWRKDFQISTKSLLRDRSGVTICSLLIFLIMSFLTSVYYTEFMESPVGKITITLSVIWYAMTFISQRKALDTDPTETLG